MKKSEKSFQSLAGICFMGVIIIGLVAGIALPDKSESEQENRILNQLPEFSATSYLDGRYETKLENYLQDQFPGRNTMIKLKVSADEALGKVKYNGVFKCNENYLMEEIQSPSIEISNECLEALGDFKTRYPSMPMYFLLAPNAANILRDKVPEYISLRNQNKYMDSFNKKLKTSGIIPVDVRKAFLSNEDKEQLYYKTDHHWTTNGAYLAYKKVAKVMRLEADVKYDRYIVKNNFRGTLASKSGIANGEDDAITLFLPKKGKGKNSIIYYEDTKEKTTEFYKLDNLKTKDAYTVFGGSNHPVYTIETPVENGGTLLLLKDSYANSMIPFLAQNYKKIIVVDPRYFYDDIDEYIDNNQVTEVLFLFNCNTFFQDDSLAMTIDD